MVLVGVVVCLSSRAVAAGTIVLDGVGLRRGAAGLAAAATRRLAREPTQRLALPLQLSRATAHHGGGEQRGQPLEQRKRRQEDQENQEQPPKN